MPRDQTTGKLMGLYDERFRGMDTKQVFNILREEQEGEEGDEGEGGNGGGQTQGGNGHPSQGQNDDGSSCLDEHGWDDAQDMTQEEKDELNREIDSALREGAMLAGRMKGNVNRDIDQLLHPKVDWREALRDFVNSTTKGKDEFTWRRMNKRHMANDIYMPSVDNETLGEVVVAIDTSGSIGQPELDVFFAEMRGMIIIGTFPPAATSGPGAAPGGDRRRRAGGRGKC